MVYFGFLVKLEENTNDIFLKIVGFVICLFVMNTHKFDLLLYY